MRRAQARHRLLHRTTRCRTRVPLIHNRKNRQRGHHTLSQQVNSSKDRNTTRVLQRRCSKSHLPPRLFSPIILQRVLRATRQRRPLTLRARELDHECNAGPSPKRNFLLSPSRGCKNTTQCSSVWRRFQTTISRLFSTCFMGRDMGQGGVGVPGTAIATILCGSGALTDNRRPIVVEIYCGDGHQCGDAKLSYPTG